MVGPESTMEERPAQIKEIACRQVLRADSSVFSIQWMTIPARHAGAVTPASLLERYLLHVRRCTFSLIRPVRTSEGIAFRLLATRTGLLSFSAPRSGGGGSARSATLRITGGFLAHPDGRGRGELCFITERDRDGVRVVVRLADYFPLLLGSGSQPRRRKLAYRLTQAFLHKRVTVGFLARLYRELEGSGTRFMVVRAEGIDGEEI